jgi:SAM-dependent methyltransferase
VPITRPADLDAVRDSYDRAADNYVEMGLGDVQTHPWLRAAIDVFADAVRDLGPVLDVGCGPGQVTAYLRERGVDASGVDLSPRMIEHARRLHPTCSFAVASVTELELGEDRWGGLMGWWSLFNLPRDVLPQVLAAYAEALVPGGQVIIATHVGDDDFPRTEAYGVPVRWTSHRWRPEQLVDLLEQAGLRPTAELRLPAYGQIGPGVILTAQR